MRNLEFLVDKPYYFSKDLFMIVSTRGRYAVRAMIDLAQNGKEAPVSLESISKRQDISRRYLDQIFISLRKAGLAKSFRGATGGYLLAKDPKQITMREIIHSVEGSLAPVPCINSNECERSGNCIAQGFWQRLGKSIDRFLGTQTLEDLIDPVRDEKCMLYTYVMRSQKDGTWHTGITNELRNEHNEGEVFSTKNRGPFEVIYYEACTDVQDARTREKYLKSGMGKRYLRNRLKSLLSATGMELR